ncbi:MAG: hypothetical protein K2X39_00280 [Silvanigrellaceae bacterium]|nr:hypothetical protein [Silvanigrellaceae bacterium]
MRKHFAQIRSGSFDPGIDKFFNKKAYCGISLSNPNYHGKRLSAVLFFLSDFFYRTLLITTGYIYRHHYRLISETEKIALLKSEEAEQLYIEEHLLPQIKQLSLEKKFEIVTWKEIYDTEEFKKYHEEVLHFYESNPSFKNDINQFAFNFIEKKMEQGTEFKVNQEFAIKASIDFLLEETSVFNTLTSARGYEVDVYPGKHIPALNNIKSYVDCPKGLKNRIPVEISIHRVGRKSVQETSKSVQEKNICL